jgi:hypothetical protein
MPGIMKQAKLKAIMDIISQMEDMELERLMPKSEEMPEMEEVKPEKKGITIVKVQSSKKPEMEMEEENEDEEEGEKEENSIDPSSSLARLKQRLKGRM